MDDRLQARLQSDMIGAMRARDTTRRDILRLALNDLSEAARRDGRDSLNGQEAIAVLALEVRAKIESAASCRAAGRIEMAQAEEAEVAILAAYLPRASYTDQSPAQEDEAGFEPADPDDLRSLIWGRDRQGLDAVEQPGLS